MPIQSFRTDNLQATEEHSMNRIPHDDSAGSAGRLPLRARDQKSDLISKVRSHHEKKGRRGNNRCRCRRRRRRGKVANLMHVRSNCYPLIPTVTHLFLQMHEN